MTWDANRCASPVPVKVAEVARPENAVYQGKSVADMAALRGQEPIDAFLTLGETPTVWQLVGAGSIMTGLLVSRR